MNERFAWALIETAVEAFCKQLVFEILIVG